MTSIWITCPRCEGYGEYTQTCTSCDGEGTQEVEYGVPDYQNGGYLTSRIETCEDCRGAGEETVGCIMCNECGELEAQGPVQPQIQ